MAIFPQLDETALFLSRTDADEPLSSYSEHGFHLDDKDWPSVAHYFHAMKFDDVSYQEKIRLASHPKKAKSLGRSRLKKIRKDWHDIRATVMTRAVYTKCREHADILALLLETDERQIVENNSYDYFWGCGRDRRGENTYGKVLMSVRNKLRAEAKALKQQAEEKPNG
ncbi:MAG: NADAR family protein [Pseudomonadales bacterium]|nr:NADAR family protein [Pseudomonadales bacterium]